MDIEWADRLQQAVRNDRQEARHRMGRILALVTAGLATLLVIPETTLFKESLPRYMLILAWALGHYWAVAAPITLLFLSRDLRRPRGWSRVQHLLSKHVFLATFPFLVGVAAWSASAWATQDAGLWVVGLLVLGLDTGFLLLSGLLGAGAAYFSTVVFRVAVSAVMFNLAAGPQPTGLDGVEWAFAVAPLFALALIAHTIVWHADLLNRGLQQSFALSELRKLYLDHRLSLAAVQAAYLEHQRQRLMDEDCPVPQAKGQPHAEQVSGFGPQRRRAVSKATPPPNR